MIFALNLKHNQILSYCPWVSSKVLNKLQTLLIVISCLCISPSMLQASLCCTSSERQTPNSTLVQSSVKRGVSSKISNLETEMMLIILRIAYGHTSRRTEDTVIPSGAHRGHVWIHTDTTEASSPALHYFSTPTRAREGNWFGSTILFQCGQANNHRSIISFHN